MVFKTLAVLFAVSIIVWLTAFSTRRVRRVFASPEDGRRAGKLAGIFLKVLATLLVFLYLLEAFGVDIAPLLAFIGLPSLALALAGRETLSNVPAVFALLFEKPFGPGDRIKIGDCEGKVLLVGLFFTRLETPSGEQIFVPNALFLTQKIKVLKRNSPNGN
jgi:small-conductance mechanosensitive channel